MTHLNRNHLIALTAVFIILFVGIFIRIDSVGISGVSFDEKEYYMDSNGQQYMYDMDSYYNYRLSKNLLEKGYLGDNIIQNQEWDTHSYFPPGVPLDYPPMIAYLSVFLYKAIHAIYPVELINVCFWIPALIAPLAGLFSFIFIYRIRNDIGGILGGLTSGLLMISAPFYFMRTVPGFYDTDMFNILFPIILVWLLFEALKSTKIKNKILLVLGSSLSLLLFSLAWNGWQFLYFVILISFLVFLIDTEFLKSKIKKNKWKQHVTQEKLSNDIKNRDNQKNKGHENRLKTLKNINNYYIVLIFLISSLILVILFNGPENLIKIIYGPLESFKLISNSIWGVWPDPYQQITELQPPGLWNTILGLGPGLIFLGFSGLLSLIFLSFIDKQSNLFKFFKTEHFKFLTILLGIWIIASCLSLFKGIRFEIILIAPLSILSGLFICILYHIIGQIFPTNPSHKDNIMEKSYEDHPKSKPGFFKYRLLKHTPIIFIILLIFIAILPSIALCEANYQNLTPRANDDLWDSAVWIKNNTPAETVVICSWVHGHFFATISDRSVNFDGRLAYIETLPVRSWEYQNSGLNPQIPNVYRAYWQAKALSTSNETLSAGILRMMANSGDDAYLLLESYNQNPAQNVQILEDILGVNRTQANHILTQKYQFDSLKTNKILNLTHPSQNRPYVFVTYDKFIENGYWIFYYGNWNFNNASAPRPFYSYGILLKNNSDILISNDNTLIDLNKKNASWNSKNPNSLIIINNISGNKTKIIKSIDPKSDFDIYLILNKNKTVIMDKNFRNSVFSKLILENKGDYFFKNVYNKGDVYLWENF